MKKLLILLLLPLLLISSCKEEGCDSSIISQHEVKIRVRVYAIDQNNSPIDQYPVRSVIQKTFCDGDVGFPIEEGGITDEDGLYWGSQYWTLPYTNRKDFVTIYLYAGPNDEKGYKVELSYNNIKNSTHREVEHIFYVHQ